MLEPQVIIPCAVRYDCIELQNKKCAQDAVDRALDFDAVRLKVCLCWCTKVRLFNELCLPNLMARVKQN